MGNNGSAPRLIPTNRICGSPFERADDARRLDGETMDYLCLDCLFLCLALFLELDVEHRPPLDARCAGNVGQPELWKASAGVVAHFGIQFVVMVWHGSVGLDSL
jgi:hypothetical protein